MRRSVGARPIGRRLGLMSLVLVVGCASTSVRPAAGVASGTGWTRTELLFGLSRRALPQISEAEWTEFVQSEIRPRFPDGYTVLVGTGHWRDPEGDHDEPARLLLVVHPVEPATDLTLDGIRRAYRRRTRPSQTAALVAWFRALANAGITQVPRFGDPTAEKLLPPRWARLLERAKDPRSLLLRRAARPGADLLALRTLAIDEPVRQAIARGVRQLVIVGAGLDGRAFRLPELAEVDVYEVDHPATQALKRERAAPLAPMAKALTYVPVDFERDSLDAALATAGHRSDVATAWIWEGVVMYLTDASFRTTLGILARRSASGSTLIVQYNTPTENLRPGSRLGALLFRTLLGLWSEPQIGLRTPEQMTAALSAVGFEVQLDSGMIDWARQYDARPPQEAAAAGSRLVVARHHRAD
jgi:methyltransferase (TIGR00027 family)